MRYTFIGKKVSFTGKTLWEIVGNLKNFGVGRLVKKCSTFSEPELSFCKVVKVVPLPPGEDQYINRKVAIWLDVIHNGEKRGIEEYTEDSDRAEFHLIPKIEEEEYLKRAEKLGTPVKHVKKYCPWPPLYKRLWEQKSLKNKCTQIPKLKYKIPDTLSYCKIVEEEEEGEKITCSLFKTEESVDDMYREIVKLKKLIKSSTADQQESHAS